LAKEEEYSTIIVEKMNDYKINEEISKSKSHQINCVEDLALIREQFFGSKGNIEEKTPRAIFSESFPLNDEAQL
jgi:hypothetical protein